MFRTLVFENLKFPNVKRSIFTRVFYFYYDGFRSMTWGRSLWIIIIIKLFIMFAVFRLFFFPDYLQKNFDDDQQRSDHVIEELTNID